MPKTKPQLQRPLRQPLAELRSSSLAFNSQVLEPATPTPRTSNKKRRFTATSSSSSTVASSLGSKRRRLPWAIPDRGECNGQNPFITHDLDQEAYVQPKSPTALLLTQPSPSVRQSSQLLPSAELLVTRGEERSLLSQLPGTFDPDIEDSEDEVSKEINKV